jgi:hypothetical protein
MLDASTHARMRFVQVLLFPALLPSHYTRSRLLRYPVTHSISTLNYPSLGALSLEKKNCLEVRVMASGWGPPQLRRVRRGSSCFMRVQSISAGPSDTCCCRRCFAGR